MLPTMLVDAFSLNSSEDKYTLDVMSDDVVYVDLSKVKTQPIVPTPSGPKRTLKKNELSLEAWLQYGTLYLCGNVDVEDAEIVIVDKENNVMFSANMEILVDNGISLNLSFLDNGVYTIWIMIEGTSYLGCFEL